MASLFEQFQRIPLVDVYRAIWKIFSLSALPIWCQICRLESYQLVPCGIPMQVDLMVLPYQNMVNVERILLDALLVFKHYLK